MKKLFLLFFVPATVFAHGGVSKSINNAIVFLNQNPLSPLIGEKVEFAFSLTDSKYQPLKGTNVELDFIDSYLNDASRDQTVLVQQLQTDENGTLVFDYSFPKTDYYDVELKFKDPVSGETDSTGFLVQPRESSNQNNWLKYFAAGGVGVIVGFLLNKFKKKKNE